MQCQISPISTGRFAAIDVGASKIAIAVGEVNASHIDILSLTSHRSAGIAKGIFIDIAAASAAIQQAVQEVEVKLGHKVTDVVMTVSGAHVRSHDSWGTTVVEGGTVSQADLDRALLVANAEPIAASDDVLATFVQDYKVDGNAGVKRPIGMAGNRLDVLVHRLTIGSTSVVNQLVSSTNAGLHAKGLVPQSYAASRAVITKQELAEGVCLADIGAGTTDIAAYIGGELRCLTSVPIGGEDITSDIANALHTSYQLAEELKITHGIALEAISSSTKPISRGAGAKLQITLGYLARLIQPRVEEIFFKISEELERSGVLHNLRHGVVLTGGTANLSGMVELGEEVFHSLVRIGTPNCVGVSNEMSQAPEYSAVIGALFGGYVNSALAAKR